jgi:hypothetical protein
VGDEERNLRECKGGFSYIWKFWNWLVGRRISQSQLTIKNNEANFLSLGPEGIERVLTQEALSTLLKSRWWYCDHVLWLHSVSPPHSTSVPSDSPGWGPCLGCWGGSCEVSIISPFRAGTRSFCSCPAQKLHAASSSLRGFALSGQKPKTECLLWSGAVPSSSARREGMICTR